MSGPRPHAAPALPSGRRGGGGDRELVLGGFAEVIVRRYFALAKRIAKIERRFRFHDLRHSFASRHAAAGTPLQVIQKMLGHASVKTTERYSRVDVNAVRAAVRALDLAANFPRELPRSFWRSGRLRRKCRKRLEARGIELEATVGFEPTNEAFAEPSLNHLGTSPPQKAGRGS